MVRIMIVDDHALMRRVVREVIEKEDDLEVVAEACNGLEAQEQAAHVKPEVVLMDLDMPECDGFEGTERVLASSPQSNVVIFTASHQERHLFQALQRGAVGYITKDIEPDALVHAIRCAARNELCLPGSFASQVVAHLRTLGKEHESRLWNELVGTDVQEEEEEQSEDYQTSAVAYRIPRRPSMRRVHALSKTVHSRQIWNILLHHLLPQDHLLIANRKFLTLCAKAKRTARLQRHCASQNPRFTNMYRTSSRSFMHATAPRQFT